MIISPDYFFKNHQSIAQKQYEALRMFYYEKVPAKVVAKNSVTLIEDLQPFVLISELNSELEITVICSSKNQKREEKILIVSGL